MREEAEEGREPALSGVGQVVDWERLVSVPGQPRVLSVLLVSTMLRERSAQKPGLPQRVELGRCEGRELSDCCSHWQEERYAASEGSAERWEEEEKREEVEEESASLRGWPV